LSVLLFLPRAILVALWIVSSLLSVILIYPVVPLSVRNAMNHRWSRALLRICGVKLRVEGRPPPDRAALWVANHVSWLDIFILSSVHSVVFIAKSEIRRWPVLGWMVAGANTIFIERGRRHAIRAVGKQMQARFDRGEVVGLFPEGTTSAGFDVSPFHSSLFDPAIRGHVSIQPVALRFRHRGRRSGYVAFVGEQNLIQNLWRLLGTTQVEVDVVFPPSISPEKSLELGRARSAALAHRLICEAVAPSRE